MQDYDHKKIEEKWQKRWAEDGLYKTSDEADGKDNFYALVEFPYPSGNLHIGHWYAFAVPDIFARFQRMNGKNVLFPMGFDAFGLPAENAAIKRGLDPREWTDQNIEYMTGQLKRMGASFDWSRSLRTIDPDYYRWTQYFFTKFFENDLAYEKEAAVNWCPSCQTVLANEQVINGECERCDTEVVQRNMKQWFLRISNYADRLVDDLDDLDWPEPIKASQKSWVGRQEGARFTFAVELADSDIEVFTTRPDTLFGVTYLAIAPEHKLVAQLLENQESGIRNQEEVAEYVKKAETKTDRQRQENKEKTGVRLEGITATHPATAEEIPIFVADYVLGGYGTGAIMAVPSHDERDFEFARKFDLPERHVVMPSVVDDVNAPRDDKPTETRENVHAIVYDSDRDAYLALHSRKHEWKTVVIGGIEDGEDALEAAKREVREETGYTDITFHYELGGPVEARYFAKHKDENRISITKGLYFTLESEEQVERIDDDGEVIWVPAEDFSRGVMINSELPHWLERIPQEGACVYDGEGVLINSGEFDGLANEVAAEKITEKYGTKETTYRLRDWSVGRQRYWGTPIPIVYDPKGQPHAVPEKHLPWTLPNDVDHTPSGDPPLARSVELKERTEEIFGEGWTPAVETMDAFIDSTWYFLRYTDPDNEEEFASHKARNAWMPVDFYSGGAEHTTMHLLYARFFYKALADLDFVEGEEPFKRRLNRGLILGPDGNKMSKSKGNVIDPDDQVERVGSDSVRAYLAFIGPYNEVGTYPWDMGGIAGVRRFFERVWAMQNNLIEKQNQDTEKKLHRTIKRVTEDTQALKFNTALSAMMEYVNGAKERTTMDQFRTFLRILAPFAPHIAEELWQRLGGEGSVHTQPWPQHDESALVEEEMTIAIQVDGKVRGEIKVSTKAAEKEIISLAKEEENVASYLKNSPEIRHIYVPNRLVNFVTEND